MSAPFFITGLPRSRTAWLANFFTWGNAFCHHDLLRLGFSVPTLKRKLQATRAEFVGDSDSALLLLAPQLVAEFPESRWLLVRRPVADAVADFQKYFGGHPYPGLPPLTDSQAKDLFQRGDQQCEDLARLVPSDRLLQVRHDELDRLDCLRRIWEWCVPLPFEPERAEMLNTFNVSIISEKVKVNP